MPLFAKKTTEPEPPASQEVVLYEPPIQPSAAPKASDLEREIRREIWQHMSPQLAHSAGLSLPELIDYVSGAARLSTVQVEALARHMGIIKTPPTDIDKIRARLNVELKKALGFSRLEWPGGGKGDDDLRRFAAGENCLTYDELNRLAKEFWGNVVLDPETAMLHGAPATPLCAGYTERWKGGSNVVGLNAKHILHMRQKLAELEAVVAAS